MLIPIDGPGKSSVPGGLKGDFVISSSTLAAQVRGFAGCVKLLTRDLFIMKDRCTLIIYSPTSVFYFTILLFL